MSSKYLAKQRKKLPFVLIPLAFVFIELFAFFFLSLNVDNFEAAQLWPLAFGALWTVLLAGLIRLLPRKWGRITFGITYFFMAVYAGFQTGYHNLFSEMMWLSDFRYASEGADYASVLLSYPLGWWLGILGMIALGVGLLRWFPVWEKAWVPKLTAAVLAVSAAVGVFCLPEAVFLHDSSIRYAVSDYGRSQSAEAAYDNMFNPHRLYQVCGLYQTACKDIYANTIHPHTPAYVQEQKQAKQTIDAYLADREPRTNSMTGALAGKNVILVLMESMDDWMIGEHTPTLCRLMEEGISFTNFYTPVYGGIRTFNTEFTINTGSFLSSAGGYAFDYVTNHYDQSLASRLTELGYSAKTFHYNDPSFYSRGEFSPAMGYSEYVCYADFLPEDLDEKERKNQLYDDLLVFRNEGLREEFFREGQPTLNFLITRSAHLSYKYNEVLSYWGLKKYPEYKGLTGNEETDCALLKARLVDDLFAALLDALEEEGQLENTVIIGVTDHYTYGYKNMESLYALSGTDQDLLLEKTPCFLWSAGLEPQKVDKVLNTSDLLPTVLNLLGVESEYRYIGHDAFDEGYEGFVPFSDGSWITKAAAYDAGKGELLPKNGQIPKISDEYRMEQEEAVHEFIQINNLILETDYYRHKR